MKSKFETVMDDTLSNLNKLIYLDIDFVSAVFQKVSGEAPTTQFSTTQGRKTDSYDISFVSDKSSLETRTFSTTSIDMLSMIQKQLDQYPTFEPNNFKNYEGTKTGWVVGNFTMGEWIHTKNVGEANETSEAHIMFELSGNEFTYALLVQPHLFASNIGSLISASAAIRRYIGIPVRALGRVLYYLEDANRFVFAPYVILET